MTIIKVALNEDGKIDDDSDMSQILNVGYIRLTKGGMVVHAVGSPERMVKIKPNEELVILDNGLEEI